MGELENLSRVRGELAPAVAERPPIADLIPDLGQPSGAPAGVPRVEDALAGLARESPPPAWSNRRLLMIAALVQAFPETFGRGADQRPQAVAALRPLSRDRSRRTTEELHELLCEPLVYASEDPGATKRTLLSRAVARRLIDVLTTTETATVEGPQGSARARVVVTGALDGYHLKHVADLLDPTTWNSLSDGRITMRPHTGDPPPNDGEVRLYYEVFEISKRLKLTPRLKVVRRSLAPTARSLEYRLADTQSSGELVTRDQGSIVIREIGDAVRITTTKRVRLTPPFDAPSLAMQADALGYVDAFEHMVRAAVERSGGVAAA